MAFEPWSEEDPYGGPPPRDLAKVLGKAVHPRAINRLVEIWPHAIVEVLHDRYDGRRTTRVLIWEHDPTLAKPFARPQRVAAVARCGDGDQWERRKGITIAFNRALKEVPR